MRPRLRSRSHCLPRVRLSGSSPSALARVAGSEPPPRALTSGSSASPLVPFAHLECVTAVAGFPVRAVMSAGVDEVAEAREQLLGIHADESGVGSHEAAHERLRRKIRIVVRLERMKRLDPDLRR